MIAGECQQGARCGAKMIASHRGRQDRGVVTGSADRSKIAVREKADIRDIDCGEGNVRCEQYEFPVAETIEVPVQIELRNGLDFLALDRAAELDKADLPLLLLHDTDWHGLTPCARNDQWPDA